MLLRYDVNSICELEEKTGKGLFKLIAEESIGFSLIRGLIWAGLKHRNRGLTLDIVGLWIQ